MLQVATVRTYFDTEKEAKDFKEWVSSRRGHNVVQPLLELDVMLCGASIKLPRQAINLEEYCHNDDEEKYYESHAANATTPAAQVDGKYNITGNQTTLSSVTRGGSAVAANTEAGEQAGTLLEQPLPIAAMTNQVYDSPAVQSGPALESSAAACECRLQLTSTFQFEPVITPDKDAQAQVEGALGIYIEALSAATAGMPCKNQLANYETAAVHHCTIVAHMALSTVVLPNEPNAAALVTAWWIVVLDM